MNKPISQAPQPMNANQVAAGLSFATNLSQSFMPQAPQEAPQQAQQPQEPSQQAQPQQTPNSDNMNEYDQKLNEIELMMKGLKQEMQNSIGTLSDSIKEALKHEQD